MAVRPRFRLAVIGIVAFALYLVASPPKDAHAYRLEFAGERDQNVCLGAYGVTSLNLFSGLGPTDKMWVVENFVGLNSGDNVQDAYFEFNLGPGLAKFHGAARNWINVGLLRPYKGTLTAHAGGTMTLQLVIDNHDPQPACYGIYSLAFYKSSLG